MLDFCKRIVKTPSISGDEGNVAEMFYHEMNRLGYDDVFIDDWGNVIGIVNGTQKDPVIMYNGHLYVYMFLNAVEIPKGKFVNTEGSMLKNVTLIKP